MLTELQERVARLILDAEIDPDLALAGGAALISLGLVPRSTVDLDLFTTEPRAEELVTSITLVLEREGMTVVRETVTPTFARLIVEVGSERCRVDVAQDARLWEPQAGPLGSTMSLDELAADKTLALFTRAEPRDYVDVYYLAQRLSKERLLELAREKDRGFDIRVFADMLAAIARLDRDEFEVDDETVDAIKAFVDTWRHELERA